MDIQKIIADAVEVYSKTSEKPIVTVYSGIEGVKEIYMDTLTSNPDEPIYAFLNPEDVSEDLYTWLDTVYVKERVKKNITANVFISNPKGGNTKKYLNSSSEEKRITHYIEDFGKPFECEVDIYGDKVALINYNPKGEISGIVINHAIMASTIKSFYLHFLWKI